jgi:hypothetical protein
MIKNRARNDCSGSSGWTSGYGSWNWQGKALEPARLGRSPFGDEGFTAPMAPYRRDRKSEYVQMASGEGRKKSSVSRAPQ